MAVINSRSPSMIGEKGDVHQADLHLPMVKVEPADRFPLHLDHEEVRTLVVLVVVARLSFELLVDEGTLLLFVPILDQGHLLGPQRSIEAPKEGSVVGRLRPQRRAGQSASGAASTVMTIESRFRFGFCPACGRSTGVSQTGVSPRR